MGETAEVTLSLQSVLAAEFSGRQMCSFLDAGLQLLIFPLSLRLTYFLAHFHALPTCWPTGNVICNFCTLYGREYIPAELITTRPHNLRFFGFSQSYENV